MKWFKMYSEIKDDPKMLALSDHQFRIWINILAMGSDASERGIIPRFPRRGLAVALHTTESELEVALDLFASEEFNLIELHNDGSILITKFADRQYENPSDKPNKVNERVRKHREQKRNENKTSSNDNVTTCNNQETAGNVLDRDIDRDIDNKKHIVPDASGTPPIEQQNGDEPGNESDNDGKKKYSFGTVHIELAERLRVRILENKPDARLPGKLEQWADTIRLMIERDKRSPERIAAVIDFCQRDQFWSRNILSADTLRKQFDKLELQARQKGGIRHGSYSQPGRITAAEVGGRRQSPPPEKAGA